MQARMQNPAAIIRRMVFGSGTSWGNCDPAVTRRLPGQSRRTGLVFRDWSGTLDLSLGLMVRNRRHGLAVRTPTCPLVHSRTGIRLKRVVLAA
jgi:hypothetical protein